MASVLLCVYRHLLKNSAIGQFTGGRLEPVFGLRVTVKEWTGVG